MKPFRFVFSALLSVLVTTASAHAECTATTTRGIATEIGYGHALLQHSDEFQAGELIDGLAFPDPTITNADDFSRFIEHIMTTTDESKPLINKRTAYWDTRTGTIVIVNLGADDCGTAFRPSRGKAYYDDTR